MNLKQLVLLLLGALLFASCSKIYSPALYHQDIAYMPKPTSFDSVKSATYVSAGIYMNADVNEFKDFLTSGQLNISEGHAFNHFNLAYGAFAVLGNYNNGTIDKGQSYYFPNEYFAAVGGRLSGDFFVKSGRADIRYIGFEAAYSHEWGGYAYFRRTVQSVPYFYVDPRTDLFTVGLTSEIIFHPVNNTGVRHGIRLFLGTTLGHNDLDGTYYANNGGSEDIFRQVFPKVSYFMQVKKFFWTVEWGESFMLRLGMRF